MEWNKKRITFVVVLCFLGGAIDVFMVLSFWGEVTFYALFGIFSGFYLESIFKRLGI